MIWGDQARERFLADLWTLGIPLEAVVAWATRTDRGHPESWTEEQRTATIGWLRRRGGVPRH